MRHACRAVLMLSLLILASYATASFAEPPPTAPIPMETPAEKTRFDYALDLYMRGAYDIAVKEFQGLIKDFPNGEYTDDAYYWLGK